MITAGLVSGPFSWIPVFESKNSTASKLLLIRFLGTFLRVSSLSPTTYSSDMSEAGMWLNREENKKIKKVKIVIVDSHQRY